MLQNCMLTKNHIALKNSISWIAIVLCCACLCMPYIISNDLLFPHITGKNFLFRVIISGSLGVIFLAFANKLLRLNDKVSIVLFLFINIKFIGLIFSEDPYFSFYSSLLRMDGVLSWIYLFGYYLLVKIALTRYNGFKYLLRFSTLLAAVSVLYIFIEWMSDPSIVLGRQTFTLGNPSYFGAHMLFHVGFAFYLLALEKNFIWKLIWSSAVILCMMGLLMSGTRASILGFAAGVIFIAAWSIHHGLKTIIQQRSRKAMFFICVVFASIIAITNCNISNVTPGIERIANTSLDQKEIRTRIAALKAGYCGWKEKPIFGWGEGNYSLVFSQYTDNSKIDRWADKCHNIIFEILSTNGLLALIAFLILVILALYNLSFKTQHGFILTGILIAWFIQNQFIFDTLNSYLLLMLLIALASHTFTKTEYSSSNIKIQIAGAAITSIIALVITWHLHKDVYHSAKHIKIAYQTQSIADYRVALSKENYTNREGTIVLLSNIQSILESDISEYHKIQAIEFTLQITKRQLDKSPSDIKLLLLSTNFYYGIIDYKPHYKEKAIELITRAKDLAPYRSDINSMYNSIVD